MSKLPSPDCHTQYTNTILKCKETYLETMKSTEPMQQMVFKKKKNKNRKGTIYQMENLTLRNRGLKPCSTSLPSLD